MITKQTVWVSGVWYDRWTPGDNTGTYIHIVTFDSGNDDFWYTRLNTSSDTLTTTVNASGASQGGSFTSGANLPSITKRTDGILYMGIHDASDLLLLKAPMVPPGRKPVRILLTLPMIFSS